MSQAIYIFGHDFTSEIRDLQDCCLSDGQTDVEVRLSNDSKINMLSAWQEILRFLVTGLSNRVSLDQEPPLNRVAVMNVLKPPNRTQIPLWPHRARIRFVRLQHGRNWHVL